MFLIVSCPLIQTATEPTSTPPADTSVPPTSTTAPTETSAAATPISTPRPKGSTLEIVNNSGQEIWYLYVSPADAEEWGEDQLGEDIIPAGATYMLSGLSDGLYDAQVRGENDNAIETVWEFEVRGTTTWEVTGMAALEVINTSGTPLSNLFLSPSESESWGEDLLGDETIPADASYLIEGVEVGDYDVRVEDSEGELVEAIYNVSLNGNYYWYVVGKSGLPENAVLRFEDDFSDNRNNWGLSDPEGADFSPPTNGEFCVEIIADEMTAWEWYEPFRTDQFIAEVACVVDSGTDGTCGLGFGPDGDNLYWFEISPYDQTFALFLLLNDEWQPSLIEWTPSSNINPGGWNFLSLERVGGVVSVFINGVLQGAVESDHFPTGRIGLGGATYSDGNVNVCIDNLRVWRLE
ncbi:MAG: hypothetical protein ACP5HS_11430 [Anaerolineae bacterium]